MLTELPPEERPAGEIRLLFQPSEEGQDSDGKSGAIRMIEDGALEGVDHTLALHVASGTDAGKIEVRSGYSMANVDSFHATIHATGGHGAAPHRGTDPWFMLAQLINAIYGIRARRVDPMEPAIISIGGVHGGDATNVIPAEVRINGTMRSFDAEVRQQLLDELEAAFGVVKALGGDYELRIERGYDATYHDPTIAELITSIASDMIGADNLNPPKAVMGAEDFGYMTKLAPGVMFNLGAKYDEQSRPHHTPVFDIDESSFALGAAILAESALQLSKQKVG
jgi:amidohydrolase